MTIEYAQSNVTVRNGANVTGNPAVLISGNNVTLRNAGYLDGESSGTIVGLTGSGTTFINEAAGNVGSDFFRSTIVGSAFSDTIINEGRIRGRVDLGAGDDVYIERRSSAEVALGDGDDRFDFVAGQNYTDMFFLSLRLDGGIGTDTLNLSGQVLKLNPIIRDFETLNVSSSLAYLNSVSGFKTINLAPNGFYELAYSLNPDVDLSLQSSLSLRGSSSLRSITGSDGQEELRLAGNVRIGGNVRLGAGSDFVTLDYTTADLGAPKVGGLIDGGLGTDQLTIMTTGTMPLTVDLTQFRNFESIQTRSGASNLIFQGVSDVATIWLSEDALSTFELQAATLDVAAISGRIQIVSGTIVGSITGPGGHSTEPAESSLSIVNTGSILGNVRLSNGDDSYQGTGSVSGVIYGFAGNDHLVGGMGSQTIDGGDGHDRLYGGIGSDQFFGGSGDDLLDGGSGADRLDGGTGNDTYMIDNAGDEVIEFSQAGVDTVISSVSFTLTAGLENLTLMGNGWIDGTGNELANYIVGNRGNNRLSTGAGDDIVTTVAGVEGYKSDAGFDVADGGDGFDTLLLGGFKSDYHALMASGRTFLVTENGAVELFGFEQGAFRSKGATSIPELLASTVAFDGLEYVASYSDLRAAFGTDAAKGLTHYVQNGFTEGRSVVFGGLEYIASYSDLRAAFGADATAGARHYIQNGASEGRSITFDSLTYLASYGDLIQAFGTDANAAARHFIQWGANEGRSTMFDANTYAANYSDLAAAFGDDADALARHYILTGYAEGRTFVPPSSGSAAAPSSVPADAFADTVGAPNASWFDGHFPGAIALDTHLLIIA
ncbi:hypothetical protein M0208_02745 [Sphingomonas sp. SUN019]|uniref:calcium-binding protein n=1 Tax=Sphingomonas sp. SUN019 TaxID=2937788 RepID=UPI0021645466|nr:calcium-binding protein [Sphingomonas sp. SUN019]UVO49482.1 hypothetical protein M0208_02745 [Sphingomonas sp. SUN019]